MPPAVSGIGPMGWLDSESTSEELEQAQVSPSIYLLSRYS